MQRIVCVLFVFTSLVGCAANPIQVDLSNSVYTKPQANYNHHKIHALSIVNEAGEGSRVNTGLGSDSIFPISTERPTRITVEEDIEMYLRQRTEISKESSSSLRIIIEKADAYWVWGGAAKIPGFGLFMVDAKTEFGINLRVTIEIEEDGKVIRNFRYDDVIRINANAATEDKIKDSYGALIARYRQVFFSKLDSGFIDRYL